MLLNRYFLTFLYAVMFLTLSACNKNDSDELQINSIKINQKEMLDNLDENTVDPIFSKKPTFAGSQTEPIVELQIDAIDDSLDDFYLNVNMINLSGNGSMEFYISGLSLNNGTIAKNDYFHYSISIYGNDRYAPNQYGMHLNIDEITSDSIFSLNGDKITVDFSEIESVLTQKIEQNKLLQLLNPGEEFITIDFVNDLIANNQSYLLDVSGYHNTKFSGTKSWGSKLCFYFSDSEDNIPEDSEVLCELEKLEYSDNFYENENPALAFNQITINSTAIEKGESPELPNTIINNEELSVEVNFELTNSNANFISDFFISIIDSNNKNVLKISVGRLFVYQDQLFYRKKYPLFTKYTEFREESNTSLYYENSIESSSNNLVSAKDKVFQFNISKILTELKAVMSSDSNQHYPYNQTETPPSIPDELATNNAYVLLMGTESHYYWHDPSPSNLDGYCFVLTEDNPDFVLDENQMCEALALD